MKCLNEKDYKYVGIEEGIWLKFKSQPKPGFDPEILLVQNVCMFNRKDGSRTLLTAAKSDRVTARA